MRRYRLQRAIPVVWVSDVSSPNFRTGVLPAGTVLDLAPVDVISVEDSFGQTVTIRVRGREGFVNVLRLKEALPDWNGSTSSS